MGLTGINILGNLSIVVVETIVDVLQKLYNYKQNKNKDKII